MVFSSAREVVMFCQPHPIARFGGGATAVLAALVCVDLRLLSGAFFIVTILSLISGVSRQYFKFLMAVMLPLGLALTIVWVGVMGAPPGARAGTDRLGALEYALLIVLRLAVCSGLFQVTLLSVTPEQLLPTLRALRLPEDLAVMVLSTLILFPELKLRADQVLTAMLARGLFGRPTFANKLGQFPRMLGPLVSWTLRSALQRAETWGQRGLIERLSFLPSGVRYSVTGSLLVALPSVVFFVLAVQSRFAKGWV
jgi:energy-coupling factor transporter transmembrane protein EcfT